MEIYPLLILLAGGIILTVGDISMKNHLVSHNQLFYFTGLLFWFIGLLFLAQSFKYKNIAVASTLLIIFNVVSLSIVSWFYFHEKINVLQIIGIFLGLASVTLLEMSSES